MIRAGTGDQDAFAELALRMRALVYSIAARYYAPGLDRDDLFQVGLIGLWKGSRAYKPALQRGDRNVTAFLAMCVHRNLKSEIKRAKRNKEQVFSDALRLDAPPTVDPDSGADIHGAIASTAPSAHALLEQREDIRGLLDIITNDLTDLERESLVGHVFNGESYADIEARIAAFDADRPGRALYGPVKVVDNAISRARLKIRLALRDVA